MLGKVVRWFGTRGFGFIASDGKEYFAHYSSIKGEGYRNLHEQDKVLFDVEESDRGPQAVNIVLVDDEPEEK